MKKFNANGEFRKDAKKEFDEHDLNNYSGHSLEETTKALDDTILFTDEEIEKIKEEIGIPEVNDNDVVR